MKCGLFTNEHGQILLVHRTPIESPVLWMEYDESQQNNALILVYKGGKIQNLGLKIDKDMKKNLTHGREVTLALMFEKEIKSTQKTVLIIKDY